jgi:AcrR family transcriptional regulator
MSEVVNRRAAAKAQTRAKAIAAARKLWAEPGTYETQGIREIAAEMGMSTGAIFSNFASKADLWREAMGYEPPVDSAEVREALKAAAAWGAQLDRAA